jgi:DNA-binding NtrC family response regulator
MARRVLIVDDEADIRSSLQDLLGLLPDLRVEVAGSFREGKAKATTDAWDIVLSDQRLPDGRGTELLAEVARAQPGTTRVLMSAFQDEDVRQSRGPGVTHFLQKPWDPAHMLRWLEGLLEQRPGGAGGA